VDRCRSFTKKTLLKERNGEKPVITNTRIANTDLKLQAGRILFPEEYDAFLEIYHNDVFVNKSREFLTEKQLEQNGPILIDLDLKYSSSVVKEYTRKTTCSTLYVFIWKNKKMYNFEENVVVPVFVFEKDAINRVVMQERN
jgi:hypothetical protein